MLTLWNPFLGFSRLSDEEFVRLADDEIGVSGPADTFTPAIDVFEEKAALVVKAELPGLKVEDVSIDVEKGVLTLRGERKPEKRDDKDGYRHIERLQGSFVRSFVLPDTVDPDQIQASLSDGILTVCLAKKPALLPRKIDIKAS